MEDKSHMVMAGLWDEWTDKKTGERVKRCTITPARRMRLSERSTIECRLFSPKRSGRSGWGKSLQRRKS
jgi:hypothetical protein